MNYDQLLDQLIAQIEAYARLHRRSTQPYTREKVLAQFPAYTQNYEDDVIRETLLEHVGNLPIIATFLHPYMDHDIDLGKALTMLAIHDIGELEVGDEHAFSKTADQGDEEVDAALALLHTQYAGIYLELNQSETNEAKFAKSVDKLAPDIYGYTCSEASTIARLAEQVGWPEHEVMQRARDSKRPYMEWSSFLTSFHDALFARFTTI